MHRRAAASAFSTTRPAPRGAEERAPITPLAVTGLTRHLPVSTVAPEPVGTVPQQPGVRITARPASEGAVLTTRLGPGAWMGTPELLLEVRVHDGSRARIVVLSTLQEELQAELSHPDNTLQAREFYLRYADVDHYLQQHNPALHFRAGDVLAVQAVWSEANGAPFDRFEGGFAQGGTVTAPPALGAPIPPGPVKAFELAGPRSGTGGGVEEGMDALPFSDESQQVRWLDATRSDARLENSGDLPTDSAR